MRRHHRRRTGHLGMTDRELWNATGGENFKPAPKAEVKAKLKTLQRVGDCCPVIKVKCHTKHVQVEPEGRYAEHAPIQTKALRVCEVSLGSKGLGEKTRADAKADLTAAKAELRAKGCVVTVQGHKLGSVKSATRKGSKGKRRHGRKGRR